jgi:uncharacterized protein (TIGR03067 family)
MKFQFFICFIGLSFFTQSILAQSFKGTWQGESNGEIGKITFDKKGYVAFIIDGEEVGGKEYVVEGVKLTMTYEYDESAQPHTLDFIISMENEEITRMLGIYKFMDKNTLMINMDFDGIARPLEFGEDDKNQVTLKRSKNKE